MGISVGCDGSARRLSVKVLSQVAVCSCQINNAECSLGRSQSRVVKVQVRPRLHEQTMIMENALNSELRLLFYELCAFEVIKSCLCSRFFSPLQNQGLGLRTLNEHKPPRSLVKGKPATLKGTLSAECMTAEEV